MQENGNGAATHQHVGHRTWRPGSGSDNPGIFTEHSGFAIGQRGDVVVIDDRAEGPELIATIVSGEIAWLSAEGACRLG